MRKKIRRNFTVSVTVSYEIEVEESQESWDVPKEQYPEITMYGNRMQMKEIEGASNIDMTVFSSAEFDDAEEI